MAKDKQIADETATDETAPADRAPETAATPAANPLRHSRTSGLWVAVVALGVVLILLVIFIVQNTQKVEVSFLGWNGRTPLAAALLIATAAGLLVATIVGTLRIWQLRRRVKRSA
jgi:uncharacterized integral membrane protein